MHWDTIESLQHSNQFRALQQEKFDYFTRIAHSIQENLNACGMETIQSLQTLAQGEGKSDAKNLVFVGGVALNSVLNGKISASGLFDQVHIPCAPGDEGIALGCAMYGYHRYQQDLQQSTKHSEPQKIFTPIKQQEILPYQGRTFTTSEIEEILEEGKDWFQVEKIFATEEELVEDAAKMIAEHQVLAWFQGRSELGQRALGHRSLLAHPGNITLRRLLNDEARSQV